MEGKKWYLHLDKIHTDYIKVENLSQWLIGDVPKANPNHPSYARFWSKESKRCIEGVWGNEWNKYRYMPGNLYFFGNYGVIEHSWEDERGVKVTEDIKPFIVDFIWDYAYQSWVAKGFSGFEKDYAHSCNIKLKKFYEKKLLLEDLPKTCLTLEGKPRIYVDPIDYLKRLHDENYGKSLFQNPTINYGTVGSRGSAKSYWAAIGELEYNFVFCGAQRYDEKYINNEYKSQQCVGAHEVTKSAEMVAKFEYSQKCKTEGTSEKFRNWFGIWVEKTISGDVNTIPSPFYKNHAGNLDCPNKEDMYRAVLKAKINGKWVENVEVASVAHVNYSPKKLGGERAAEGGRYIYSVIEECGSASNLIEIVGANEGTLTRGGVRIGYQAIQGTSGNLTSVQATKKIMLDPRSYNMIAYKNILTVDGANGEAAYFVPYYITLFQFKDKNGNTDFKRAIQYVNDEREQLAASKDPAVLRDFCMNKPCFMHEMWWSDAGYYLPYEEFAERERELMFNQHYKSDFHRKCVELVWMPDGSVKQNILFDATPFDEWPIPKEMSDPSGCIVIYEQPEINAPHDLYFYTCDPYVEQDLELGGSLAVTYIWKSHKYSHLGYDGNKLVASYIGKPSKGLEYYYEQQEKLIHLYGNSLQGLWFDARGGGETLREYYIKKGKQYLLCMRPGLSRGQSAYNSNLPTHGIVISSLDSKKTALKQTHDWCLQETEYKDNSKRKNVHRIPCMFLIKQAMTYNLKDNFDAVSSFYFMPIALHETTAREELAQKQQSQSKLFTSLLNNSKIFKQK